MVIRWGRCKGALAEAHGGVDEGEGVRVTGERARGWGEEDGGLDGGCGGTEFSGGQTGGRKNVTESGGLAVSQNPPGSSNSPRLVLYVKDLCKTQ